MGGGSGLVGEAEDVVQPLGHLAEVGVRRVAVLADLALQLGDVLAQPLRLDLVDEPLDVGPALGVEVHLLVEGVEHPVERDDVSARRLPGGVDHLAHRHHPVPLVVGMHPVELHEPRLARGIAHLDDGRRPVVLLDDHRAGIHVGQRPRDRAPRSEQLLASPAIPVVQPQLHLDELQVVAGERARHRFDHDPHEGLERGLAAGSRDVDPLEVVAVTGKALEAGLRGRAGKRNRAAYPIARRRADRGGDQSQAFDVGVVEVLDDLVEAEHPARGLVQQLWFRTCARALAHLDAEHSPAPARPGSAIAGKPGVKSVVPRIAGRTIVDDERPSPSPRPRRRGRPADRRGAPALPAAGGL
jgi:hypothetical protein